MEAGEVKETRKTKERRETKESKEGKDADEEKEVQEAGKLLCRALQQVLPDCSQEERDFLTGIQEEALQGIYFICLIYRIPVQDLKNLASQRASVEQVVRFRNQFEVKRASDRDPGIRKAEEALAEVSRMTAETEEVNRQFREELTRFMETTEHKNRQEQEKLRREMSALQEAAEELRRKLRENEAKAAKAEEGAPPQKKLYSEVRFQPEESILREERVRVESGFPPEPRIHEKFLKKYTSRRERRAQKKFVQDLRRFFQKLTDQEGLTEEQRNFLLSCVERGDPPEIVSQVITPTLTVRQMEQFIRIYEKHTGGQERYGRNI